VTHTPILNRTLAITRFFTVAALLGVMISCQSPIRPYPNNLASSFGEDSAVRQREAIQLAAEAYEEEDSETAITMYRDSVNLYRDLYPAWNNLGTLLMEQKRFLEAAEAFNTAAGLAPSDGRPLYNIGQIGRAHV